MRIVAQLAIDLGTANVVVYRRGKGGGRHVNDIFKTIKYGVPAKGMIAWKSQLRPSDIQNLASYILTMQGTNPPNAKEPQGELYEEKPELGMK